jgi:Tfp pilus assembly protein PilV
MKYSTFRPAIAMIELIFAIVIMGISLLAIPSMLATATKSSIVAFQQESIAIIASHTNALMSYHWDEFNTQIYATTNNLLTVTNGDILIDGNSTLNQANQTRTKTAINAATLPASFGYKKDTATVGSVLHIETIKDDIDDFHDTDANLSISLEGSQLSTQGDYMDIDIQLNTQITYLLDNANYSACSSSTGCAFSKDNDEWGSMPAVQTSNIKLITTTLTSSNVSEKKILLRSFMCNIGSVMPNTRGGF